MKYLPPKSRFALVLSHCCLLIAVVAALALVPVRAAAQAQAPTANASPATAASPSTSPAPAEKSSDSDQEEHFLHSGVVQSMARMLHLSLDTTVDILVGINFAIIFFAIAIPLGRMMPKIVRKRSQTLKHDLGTARDATADAQARLSAVEAKLAGLDEEMRKFRAQVEQDGLEDEKRIKASIGEESTRIVAAAEQEIEVAANQARRELRHFAADLAIDRAAKQISLSAESPPMTGAL